MSRSKVQPVEVYVRHQSGPSALLTFHLNPDQRLKLIEALATGQEVAPRVRIVVASIEPRTRGRR